MKERKKGGRRKREEQRKMEKKNLFGEKKILKYLRGAKYCVKILISTALETNPKDELF